MNYGYVIDGKKTCHDCGCRSFASYQQYVDATRATAYKMITRYFVCQQCGRPVGTPPAPRVPRVRQDGPLTAADRALLDTLIASAKQGSRISIYEETSLSGKSATLRYSRKWVEPAYGHWSARPRSESHMLFSVTIPEDPQGEETARKKFSDRAEAAQRYFATFTA